MMKSEFEVLLGKQVSEAEYAVIEKVYMFYPNEEGITLSKSLVAEMFRVYGLRVFKDMLPRAERVEKLEDEMRALKKELATL